MEALIVIFIVHTLPFCIVLHFLIKYNWDIPSINGLTPKRRNPITREELIKAIATASIPLLNFVVAGVHIYEELKRSGWLDKPAFPMVKEDKEKQDRRGYEKS